MLDIIYREFQEVETKVVDTVLTKLLGRRPSVEDYKKCTRAFREGDDSQYHLSYDNMKLGIVKFILPSLANPSVTLGVEFIPYTIDQLLEPMVIGNKVNI